MKNYLWNMFANIKNGQMSNKKEILHIRKKIGESFLKILWDEGFLLGYENCKDAKKVKIFLKYTNGQPAIKSIKIISRPSMRINYSVKQIWKINSTKLIVFSTNQGLKSALDCKRLNLGGEPFIVVY